MIIDSKNETLNFILLRKGGDKLFIHKSIKKPDLPPIINSSRNKINRNLFLFKPFLNELNSSQKMNMSRNSNNFEKDTTLKTKSIVSETQKIDDSIFDAMINTNTNSNSNKKTRSLGTSYNFNDFSPDYNKSLNEIKNDKNNEINKAYFSRNNNLFNNNFIKYKSNILTFDSLKKQLDENMDNHASKSIETPRIEKDKSKEKKQFIFMKNLQNNNNFVIHDYKFSKRANQNNLSYNTINKMNYNIDRSYNNNKKRRAILIKDIAINSLLSEYEKNKSKLTKLTPFIIRDNYMRTKYGLNLKPEINNYELKMDISKNFKFPIKYKNYRSFFDLAKTYQQ